MVGGMTTDEFSDSPDDRARPSTTVQIEQEGFSGPLHLLLDLARRHRVELKTLSMRDLVETLARLLDEELGDGAHADIDGCAEHVVSAAWLVALKARELIRELAARGEDAMAAVSPDARALAFRLQRRAAMQAAGEHLDRLPRLARDHWTNAPPRPEAVARDYLAPTLWQVMKAYGRALSRHAAPPMRPEPQPVLPLEAARTLVADWVMGHDEWTELSAGGVYHRTGDVPEASVTASMVAASLELARDEVLALRQDRAFGPIMVRRTAA